MGLSPRNNNVNSNPLSSGARANEDFHDKGKELSFKPPKKNIVKEHKRRSGWR